MAGIPSLETNIPGSLWGRAVLDGHLSQETLLCLASRAVLESLGLLCLL